ncbi:hypothetical protein C8R45DRAFT_1188746 [Mycena sanguinolenta]|nr:hypothetical protein C8R45DRAFT_1188746 [Mycena sanguinolenta]
MDNAKFPVELRDNPGHSDSQALISEAPFEILAKIFLEFRDIALVESPPSLQAFMPVSQVCGHWRDVAHHIQELWVHMFLNFHGKRPYRRHRKLLEQWAARSHPRPLTIAVRSCYPRPENPVFDLILANASRISELSLNIPAAHLRRFLEAPVGSFPVLEKLTLDIIATSEAEYYPPWGMSRHEFFHHPATILGDSDREPVWGTLAAITSLDNTPRLHSISIQTSGFQPLDARMLPLAWTNLISIDLERVGLSVDDTAYLLPQCTRARLLRFTTKTEASWESMPPIARVCIPELTELKWWGLDVDDFSIFDRLILPRLARLEFREVCANTVYSLYSHSNFSLTKLKLVLVRFMDAERFFTFLREMPNLTSLDLHLCIPITNKFLSLLTYDPDKNPVLPSLEYIMLADWEQKFSESVMLRMVESRWGPTPFARGQIRTNLMLPNVRVTNTPFFWKAAPSPPSELHLSVRKRIAELWEEGLKFEYENEILQA